jgi:hypothetical protein
LIIPIGGADMPTVISILNSYAGLSAVAMGFVLNSSLLVVAGALDGSSGLILSIIMCRAMNRSFTNVLFGAFGTVQKVAATGEQKVWKQETVEGAAQLLDQARLVVIIPGYGMAVAQAQHKVRELYDALTKRGITVKFAIHPVAGRMPGHMNVLLAEANIPYTALAEMDEINPEMPQCDVALVIGANDVVNPAARYAKGSPIYGMPIIDADKAKTVLAIKRSKNPGFAGIDNRRRPALGLAPCPARQRHHHHAERQQHQPPHQIDRHTRGRARGVAHRHGTVDRQHHAHQQEERADRHAHVESHAAPPIRRRSGSTPPSAPALRWRARPAARTNAARRPAAWPSSRRPAP